jgi:mannose-6-phosphate isomerase-like protein (cupin superfamily)
MQRRRLAGSLVEEGGENARGFGEVSHHIAGEDEEVIMAGHRSYSIHLNPRFAPLELVDVQALVDAVQDPWHNQTLCQVNDCVVRLGVVHGEFHWHQHDQEDEFFYVVEGCFVIDLEGRTVELRPRQGFTVPKGVPHRTRAPERTVILMIEGAGVVPTGDAR